MKKISSPSVLHSFLSEYGLKAKKQSSQNFLIDGNIIDKIIEAANVEKGDVVVEIGPGPGALTQMLLEKGAYVLAVEKDPSFASALFRLQTEDGRLKILCEDILKCNIQEHLSPWLHNNQKVKVVANLPYHITTPILSILLPRVDLINTMTVMVQREVAIRMTASKGTKDYSSLTLFIQHFGSVKYCFTVEPSCFYPRPSVQSAVVTFTLCKASPVEDESCFFSMIRRAFLQRRKMLKSSLKELYSSSLIELALKELGMNPLARPEELSREDFLALYLWLKNKSAPPSLTKHGKCDD